MLLNYHIGRFFLGSMYVGDLVRLGLSSIRITAITMMHGPINTRYSNIKYNENLSCGSELYHANGRTNRQRDTMKLTLTFLNFSNAPVNLAFY